MKGGGIVVLVIFVFLFVCFLWGIASIVGGARDAIKSKRSTSQADQPQSPLKPFPTLVQERMPGSSMDAVVATKPNEQDVIASTLEHLQKICELHSRGALTNEEFVRIKAKLMQSINRA